MKTIKKIIALVMLIGAFVGCTIVMPTVDTANTSKGTSSTNDGKESTYKRPTPSTTVGTTTPPTRPTIIGSSKGETAPVYTRPTPTTTNNSDGTPTYTRPRPSSTTNSGSSGSVNTSKDIRSDGRIDDPTQKKSQAKAVSDTTIQARSRVRR